MRPQFESFALLAHNRDVCSCPRISWHGYSLHCRQRSQSSPPNSTGVCSPCNLSTHDCTSQWVGSQCPSVAEHQSVLEARQVALAQGALRSDGARYHMIPLTPIPFRVLCTHGMPGKLPIQLQLIPMFSSTRWLIHNNYPCNRLIDI
jgi:hypothetical protein